VFAGSFMIRNRRRPLEQRIALLPLMSLMDLFPRVALIAMIPVGLALSYAGHWAPIPGWLVWLSAAVGLAWLAAVIRQFRSPVPVIRRVDFAWRVLVMVLAFGVAIASLAGAGPFPAWLGVKIGLFGVIVACGLWIRLIPFEHAIRELAAGSTLEREGNYARVQGLALIPVLTIWGSLVVITFVSVAKPHF
jgi:hypothetical protein